VGYFDVVATPETCDELPGQIDAATVEQVNEMAGRMLRSDNRTIGWFEPLS